MKTAIDCDAVFERLTRAPFPGGGNHDEDTELHLQACHDCRSLAEALRPAIGLFHESLADGESLPEYNGRLPETAEFGSKKSRCGALFGAGLAACALAWLGFVSSYRAPIERGPSPHVSAVPDASGFSLLVALRLPDSCQERVSLATAQDARFRCCTECHRFGGSGTATNAALRALNAACSACHRPPENSTAVYFRLHFQRLLAT